MKRFRAWRLQRARLRLADLEHYLAKWGWSDTPSQRYATRKRITRAEAKVAALERKEGE